MHPLDINFSSPLEREYEAWIVQGIQQYFKSLGVRVAVWAVSPRDEVNWPADEQLIIGKKVIGLQLKKVEYKPLSGEINNHGKLYWSFQNPPAQYDLVVKFPEIFYCLPTFVNRYYQEQALHHCLFWRPEPGAKKYKNAWYDNPKAHKSHTPLFHSPRWGLFIEKVLDCKIGKKMNSMVEAEQYVSAITAYMRDPISDVTDVDDTTFIEDTIEQRLVGPQEQAVYLVALPFNE